MSQQKRFADQKLTIAHFYSEVWVKCPQCSKMAIATVDFDTKEARLICVKCGYAKTQSTAFRIGAKSIGHLHQAAHAYFNADLWLVAPFGEHVFWAYNDKHLTYLEAYIDALLREHPDRTGYTMLEKLPKFIQVAANRRPLLKIIEKMKQTYL